MSLMPVIALPWQNSCPQWPASCLHVYCEDDWLANAVLRLQHLTQAQRSDLDAWLADIAPAEPCVN